MREPDIGKVKVIEDLCGDERFSEGKIYNVYSGVTSEYLLSDKNKRVDWEDFDSSYDWKKL